MNFEQLGLLGIFIAGAIPWFEAVAVVPAGILFGLNPWLVVFAAVVGNAVTIFVFAYAGARIRQWVSARRSAKGKKDNSHKYVKAQQAFEKWGIYGLALLGPIVIGTQFCAAIAVAAGTKPLRTSLIITAGMALWAIAIAGAMVLAGLNDLVDPRLLGGTTPAI